MSDDAQLKLPTEGESCIDLFQKKAVRKTLHAGEWWFAVKDVIESLVDTVDGTDYVGKLRERDEGLRESYRQIVVTLPFQSPSGIQKTNFVNIEGIFRIMQSVPSAKAEPFKKWLAKVGFERLQEENNPELAVKRAMAIYRAKGYDDDWIEARIGNKVSRELLTQQWDENGMSEYIGLLTNAISEETFGISIKRHRDIKQLKSTSQNLRDNMTPLEITLTTLGEQTTREITKNMKPEGLPGHIVAARQGGAVAGSARRNIERAINRPIVSSKNYLTPQQIKNNAKLDSDVNLKKLLPYQHEHDEVDDAE